MIEATGDLCVFYQNLYHRPVRVGMTEISGVPAYNPFMTPK